MNLQLTSQQIWDKFANGEPRTVGIVYIVEVHDARGDQRHRLSTIATEGP